MANSVVILDSKEAAEHHELERAMTVQPLPESVKAEGGLLLDIEEQKGQTSLRLASDGHVSQALSHDSACLNGCYIRPSYFHSRLTIRMIRSTGHGPPNISSCLLLHGERSVQIGLLPPARRSSSSRQHNGTWIQTLSINLTASTSCLG